MFSPSVKALGLCHLPHQSEALVRRYAVRPYIKIKCPDISCLAEKYAPTAPSERELSAEPTEGEFSCAPGLRRLHTAYMFSPSVKALRLCHLPHQSEALVQRYAVRPYIEIKFPDILCLAKKNAP